MIKAILYTLICVVSWAFIPVASKEILKDMNNYAMLLFSNAISTVVLFFYLLLSRKVNLLKKYSLKDYLTLSFLGFLGSYLFYIVLYKAFSLSLAQEVFIINYTWPILIVLLSAPILKEQLTLTKLISIAISFFGVIIILTRGNLSHIKFTSAKGDLLALLASFCFALFSVLGKMVQYDQIISVFIYFLSATVFSLLTLNYAHIKSITANSLFWLFINGVFINGISYIFWFKALKSTKAVVVSNIAYLTPALSLLFISAILREKIETYSIFGLMFILAGISMQLKFKST